MPTGSLPDLFARDDRSAAVRVAMASAMLRRGHTASTRAIEARRSQLLRDQRPMNTRLPHQPEALLPLADIVDRVAKRGMWSRFLGHLVSEMGATTVVELGSSVGLSTAHLAASTNGVVHTFEGVPGIAEIARETAAALGLADRVVVHVGRFKDVLPSAVGDMGVVDLAFIDGDHEGAPTLTYLEMLRPVLGTGSVVVFDDIRWSAGMKSAWAQIRSRPDTGLAIDLGRLGVWGRA